MRIRRMSLYAVPVCSLSPLLSGTNGVAWGAMAADSTFLAGLESRTYIGS